MVSRYTPFLSGGCWRLYSSDWLTIACTVFSGKVSPALRQAANAQPSGKERTLCVATLNDRAIRANTMNPHRRFRVGLCPPTTGRTGAKAKRTLAVLKKTDTRRGTPYSPVQIANVELAKLG